MNRTRLLTPEVLPYASVVVIPAGAAICAWCPDWLPVDASNAGQSHGMCTACVAKLAATLVPITVPERFRDLPMADSTRPCDVCGLRASFHYDGWDGNYLGCDEACARRGFHALLTDPATGPKLDAALAECAAIDARLAEDDRLDAEREGDGNQCGSACGGCGRCT